MPPPFVAQVDPPSEFGCVADRHVKSRARGARLLLPDCHRRHRLSPVDPADEFRGRAADDDLGTATAGRSPATVGVLQDQTRRKPPAPDPSGGAGPQPERFLQLTIRSRLEETVRAGHILGVDVVLAKCVAVVLPAIQGHAGDRTRLRAKLVDEIPVRPPATDQFSALSGERGERGQDHASPSQRLAFDRPQVERQIVREPACTQRCRSRIHGGQSIAAALELAVSDVGGAHPSILAAAR